MSGIELSGREELCARCVEPAVAMCIECADMLCRRHLDPGKGLASWVISSRMMSSRMGVCTPCCHAKFWRFVRGVVALGVVGVLVTCVLEGYLPAALGAALILGGWWLTATLLARRADTDLERERLQGPLD